LDKHSQFWNLHAKHAHGGDAKTSYPDIYEYAGAALAGDNPVKIAKVAQMIAGASSETNQVKKITWLVDRLILADVEYLNSLDGLECAFEHGKLLTDLSQMKSSW
jgi:hypothetical protein